MNWMHGKIAEGRCQWEVYNHGSYRNPTKQCDRDRRSDSDFCTQHAKMAARRRAEGLTERRWVEPGRPKR